MTPSPLVDVAWLAAHVSDPDLRVVDVRWYLSGKRGLDAYAAGHLPGAVFADLDTDLASARGSGPGRHPLPDAARFAAALARLGIGPRTTVVAYDDVGGAIAARLWWLLRYFGHPGGRVLDGGLPAWVAAGHPLSTNDPVVDPVAPLDLRGGHMPHVDRAAVLATKDRPGVLLLDARAVERFEGRVEPIDARPGHIPGARNAPHAGNLGEGGRLLSGAALRARYEALGVFEAQEVICYCGSGVTACHDVLALELAGREGAALYGGSWSDWAGDPSLPAALGPEG